ncbi:MAG: cupredoxin domain-containing protein [Patescibacteria group bacterium]
MKKILFLLSVLVLTGTGCAKTPEVQKTGNTLPNNQNQTETTTASSTIDTSGETTLKTNSGGEIVYKTPPKKVTKNEDDDVPVTDIYLGEAQVKVNMEVGNTYFKPTIIDAKPSDAVELTFTKVQGTHTFVIDGTNANFQITNGSKNIFTAPNKPGSYPFYCTVGNHRSAGMVGTLIVK